MNLLSNESVLAGAALALGARNVSGWSRQEEQLAARASPVPSTVVSKLLDQIQNGNDPLGDAFCELRPQVARRSLGATYTPAKIVSSMLSWAASQKMVPTRIVEPGAGSSRFLMAAGKHFRSAELIAIEIDSLPALITRANLAACGLADRSSVRVQDYRSLVLPPAGGATLYIGNPPYVRHHQIHATTKQWLTEAAARLGYDASQLSGLHVYFYLATAIQARAGDYGVFITAAEWLDVNYGRLVRQLFLKELGGESLTVIEPSAKAFEDAATTSAISTFFIGSAPPSIRVARVANAKALGDLQGGQQIHRGRLESESRWSHLMRAPREIPQGFVELGELCRVHRGQVTGKNRVWIAGPHSENLPARVLFRAITRARELFRAEGVLADASELRNVIDLPTDLDMLEGGERKSVEEFLRYAKQAGASSGYVAKNRRAWWSVGLKSPAPILATYMARRPPAFVRNLAGVRHINIAHGLYPRVSLTAKVLDKLATYLSGGVSLTDGRTYAGGLTKFEPREMERLIVPSPEVLAASAGAA